MKKITVAVVVFLISWAAIGFAQDQAEGRYKFYTVKNGANDLALLLDSATGKTWQVFVDATGKITQLSALTVEGVAYAPKDAEQLYSKVQSANIEGLVTSNSAVKTELNQLYGYGLDGAKLTAIRDKVQTATSNH